MALYNVRKSLDKRVDGLASRLRAQLSHTGDASALPSSSELSARFLEDKAYVEALRVKAQRCAQGLERRPTKRAKRPSCRCATASPRSAQGAHRPHRRGDGQQAPGGAASGELPRPLPPELVDPLRMQRMLRDDEEYCRSRAKMADEFVERYAEEQAVPRVLHARARQRLASLVRSCASR